MSETGEFTFEPTNEGVPVGAYEATFASIEEFTSESGVDYGPAVRLNFKVEAGEHEGEIATRVCSRKFSPKSNLYAFGCAIMGGPIDSAFDFLDYLGTRGMIVVEACGKENEATRVASFIRNK